MPPTAARNTVLARFGKNVRSLRRDRGLSQEQLADLAKLDRTYVGGVERGERNVGLLNIIRIASSLGVSASELLQNVSGR